MNGEAPRTLVSVKRDLGRILKLTPADTIGLDDRILQEMNTELERIKSLPSL